MMSFRCFQLDESCWTAIQRTTLPKWNSQRFARRTWCLALNQVLTRCSRYVIHITFLLVHVRFLPWHTLYRVVGVSAIQSISDIFVVAYKWSSWTTDEELGRCHQTRPQTDGLDLGRSWGTDRNWTKQNGVNMWPNAVIWMRDELRSKV